MLFPREKISSLEASRIVLMVINLVLVFYFTFYLIFLVNCPGFFLLCLIVVVSCESYLAYGALCVDFGSIQLRFTLQNNVGSLVL